MSSAWKVAYADFMTAMMAFFLLMWLLSVLTEEQKSGIATMYTPDGKKDSNIISPIGTDNITITVDKLDTREFRVTELEESHYAIVRVLEPLLQQNAVLSASSGITSNTLGALMHITSNLMFKPGTVEFTDTGAEVLDEVIKVMNTYDVYLVVRGHADSSESGAPYPSKWELSAARANAAVMYLIDHGIDPSRVRSMAYADTQPQVPPTVADAAQINARVEFNFHRPEVMSTIVNY